MIECYGGSRPQVERSTNEDAFVIGRDPTPYAAVCDGAGIAQQAAHHVVRFFERMIKDPQAVEKNSLYIRHYSANLAISAINIAL